MSARLATPVGSAEEPHEKSVRRWDGVASSVMACREVAGLSFWPGQKRHRMDGRGLRVGQAAEAVHPPLHRGSLRPCEPPDSRCGLPQAPLGRVGFGRRCGAVSRCEFVLTARARPMASAGSPLRCGSRRESNGRRRERANDPRDLHLLAPWKGGVTAPEVDAGNIPRVHDPPADPVVLRSLDGARTVVTVLTSRAT